MPAPDPLRIITSYLKTHTDWDIRLEADRTRVVAYKKETNRPIGPWLGSIYHRDSRISILLRSDANNGYKMRTFIPIADPELLPKIINILAKQQ